MRLYHIDLGDPGAAWTAGLRVARGGAGGCRRARGRSRCSPVSSAATASGRASSRPALAGAARQNGRRRRRSVRSRPSSRTSPATGSATATAERAWITVLEVEPDAQRCIRRADRDVSRRQRWTDLRALLERRAEVTLDQQRSPLRARCQLAELEEEIARRRRAGDRAAYRRVLELDGRTAPSYHALDRLYTTSEQWTRARGAARAPGRPRSRATRCRSSCAYRRAELWAHAAEAMPSRAVDLLEDVLGEAAQPRGRARAARGADDRSERPAVTMRVARLLEPLYEQDKLWKDLVGVLRAQRALVDRHRGGRAARRGSRRSRRPSSAAPRTRSTRGSRCSRSSPRTSARASSWRGSRSCCSAGPRRPRAFEAAVTATPDGDVGTRAALLGELATYYDTQVGAGDAPRAITAYQRLLEADPSIADDDPSRRRRARAALRGEPELAGAARHHAPAGRVGRGCRPSGARCSRASRSSRRSGSAIATPRSRRGATCSPISRRDAGGAARARAAVPGGRELARADRHPAPQARHRDQRGGRCRCSRADRRDPRAASSREPDEAIARVARDPRSRRRATPARWTSSRASTAPAERHADLLDVLERQAMLDDGPAQTASAHRDRQAARRTARAAGRGARALVDSCSQADPQHPTALAAVEAALERSRSARRRRRHPAPGLRRAPAAGRAARPAVAPAVRVDRSMSWRRGIVVRHRQ